jgi:hypothetical protein
MLQKRIRKTVIANTAVIDGKRFLVFMDASWLPGATGSWLGNDNILI